MRSVSPGFVRPPLSFCARAAFIQNRPGSNAQVEYYTAHLAGCSFCDAELRFLTKYPPPSLSYEPAVMSEPSVVGPMPTTGRRSKWLREQIV